MLPQRFRLKDPKRFQIVLSRGQSILNCPFYRVLGIQHANQTTSEAQAPQIGFIISKKVHKRAVIRNRLKRQLRHGIRPYLENPSRLWQYNAIVCIVKPQAVGEEYQALSNPLKQLLQSV